MEYPENGAVCKLTTHLTKRKCPWETIPNTRKVSVCRQVFECGGDFKGEVNLSLNSVLLHPTWKVIDVHVNVFDCHQHPGISLLSSWDHVKRFPSGCLSMNSLHSSREN